MDRGSGIPLAEAAYYCYSSIYAPGKTTHQWKYNLVWDVKNEELSIKSNVNKKYRLSQ